MSKVNMTTEICGVKLATPVIGASGTIGFGLDYADYLDFSRVGGICLKALTPEPRAGNGTPRIAETPSGILNSVGLQNPGIDAFLKDIYPRLSELDTVKIANVAGRTTEDYVTVVRKLAETDIPLYEINVSCPNVKVGGASFGTDETALAELVSSVKKVSERPIIVKLTPNVTDIVKMAKVAEESGADAVCLINTLLGMAIDLKTRRPILANITGGLSGRSRRHIVRERCSRVYACGCISCGGRNGNSQRTGGSRRDRLRAGEVLRERKYSRGQRADWSYRLLNRY